MPGDRATTADAEGMGMAGALALALMDWREAREAFVSDFAASDNARDAMIRE